MRVRRASPARVIADTGTGRALLRRALRRDGVSRRNSRGGPKVVTSDAATATDGRASLHAMATGTARAVQDRTRTATCRPAADAAHSGWCGTALVLSRGHGGRKWGRQKWGRQKWDATNSTWVSWWTSFHPVPARPRDERMRSFGCFLSRTEMSSSESKARAKHSSVWPKRASFRAACPSEGTYATTRVRKTRE